MTTYGEAVKALLRAGFTNRNIIDMTKADGRDEVRRLGELALEEEGQREAQDETT